MSENLTMSSHLLAVYFSPAYCAAAHTLETTRKAGWIADSLRARPIEGVELREPVPLTAEEIARVHSPAYVDAVYTGKPRILAESQGFQWDYRLWEAVCASNGGAVAAALEALRCGGAGSLSSGMHHARRDEGRAFCTFNGLALAARAALDAGARSVLILDLDAHCGGGTHALVRTESRIRQLDISVNWLDEYSPEGAHTLDIVERASKYLPCLEERLAADERLHESPGLVLYNAGMDPFEGCGIGGLDGITLEILAQREKLVFEWCHARRIPVAFVLAGGYKGGGLDQDGLVELHRLTISAAITCAR